MQEKTINLYFLFGTSVRFLQDVREGMPIHGNGQILQNVDSVFQKIKDLNLIVSNRSMAAKDLARLYGELKEKEDGYLLTQDDVSQLSKIMSDLKHVIDAETIGHFAYIVTDKKIDTKKLLFNVKSLMDSSVFDNLDDLARYDFSETGKCIAFERPTAAAFHMLRGTESVLRSYYCLHIKRNRLNNPMWGQIVESLRKKKRNSPPKELLDNLDNIRHNFRNPTQHPDKIYDIQEVQNLFWLCVDVVNRMQKEISKSVSNK